ITPDDHSTSCCRGVPTIKTVFRLLTEDLGLRNLLSVLVPHQLSEANNMQRVKFCQDLLKLFQDHKEDFLGSHLLVQDDSGSTGIRRSGGKSGRSPRGPVLDPPCETDSKEDDDSDGVHLQAEVADRNTMIEYLRTTGKRFLSLKKDKIRLKDCLLLWDNARPHTATDTREFLTRGRGTGETVPVPEVEAPSPGGRVRGPRRTTLAVQLAMRRVSEDELYDQLKKLRGHCHDVIAVGGDYVY
ncbi:Uncharacterized protein FKW44_020223, partial [Caligus rogercresseyi]